MSDPPKKANAYNSTTSDTSFRKTWDRAEYAAKAEAREAKVKEEGKARYEAKLAGKKYVPRASTPPDAKETEYRSSRLDVTSNVGKTTLVPAGAAIGKRGKGAGFYCEDCDLTFKDNLLFFDLFNSRQLLVAVGQWGDVIRAGVKERAKEEKRRKRRERRRKTEGGVGVKREESVEGDGIIC